MEDTILLKDKLTSEEKIKYILDLQDKGLSRKQIREDMGYKKTGSLTDLMKRYGYVVVNEKFIKGGERHPHDTHNIVVGSISDATLSHDTEMQEKLFNMINKYDKFIEVLDWYESERRQVGGTSPIVEIVQGLQINYKDTKTMKTSIRIDEEVWEKFKELGDDKYKHISNAKLISQAVHEFVEKYK